MFTPSSANPWFILSGFVTGCLVGMTGIGGGSLMTPILVLLFGIEPSIAVGTDLIYASITKTAGTAVHGLGRTIDWRIVGLLALGSLPMTVVTLLVFAWFGPNTAGANRLITNILSVMLLLTALVLIFRRQIVRHYSRRFVAMSPETRRQMTIVVGMMLGILVPLSSVGAGALGATALILLYPNLPMARIVGSDIAHAVPLTLAAGFGHIILGLTNFGILVFLLSGSIPGIVLGSYAAPRVPDAVLRFLLAGTLLIVGARLAL
jgi:uncharacterized membrane protein YfcA